MSSKSKIVTLSVALAALTAPSLAITTSVDAAPTPATDEGVSGPQLLKMPVGEELMAFTVGVSDDGTVIADHYSHSSHASHESHSSHASSSY